jgi:hypothetical protein
MRVALRKWAQVHTWAVIESRELLRTVLVGRLTFTRLVDRRGYHFEGALALDKVLAGIVELPAGVASPTGFNPFTAFGALGRAA